jgi:hypothetical protein
MSRFSTFTFPDKDEKASTTRPAQSAYLLIDSRDRYNLNKEGLYDQEPETSPNNIIINHERALGSGQIKRIAVTEFSFPWSTPNVNQTNNTLTITDDVSDQEYIITIDEDFYTPSELADAIQSKLSSTGWVNATTGVPAPTYNAPWACTTDNINRFTIASSLAGTTWTVKPDSGLSNIMNIYNKSAESDGTVNFITGGIPSMAYTKYIDVCSKTLTKFQNLKDSLTQLNYSDIICRIYLENNLNTPLTDTSYFSSRPCINLSRQIVAPKYILWNENEMITSIDIQLYDDAGDLLYIPEDNWDLDYFLTLQMSES